VWIDRRSRLRPILIAMDIGRAAFIALVPISLFVGFVSVPLLIAVAFAGGALTLVFWGPGAPRPWP
jgi:hypothetical protein